MDRETSRRPGTRWIGAAVAAAVASGIFLAAWITLDRHEDAPAEHDIVVTASSYAFDPPVIRVRRGDTLRLRFAATDVVHGFALEGHDLDVTIPPLSREFEVERDGTTKTVDELVFVADRTGKFRYRCSITCGAMHPFMTGELVVGPNRLFQTSGLAAVTVLIGTLAVAWRRGPDRREPR